MSDGEIEHEQHYYEGMEAEDEESGSIRQEAPVVVSQPSTSAPSGTDKSAAKGAKKGENSKSSERLGADATKLLSQLTNYFDEKIENLKREIVDEDVRSAKRVKPSYDFKRKSNKKNYEHNSDVQSRMEEAKRQLNKSTPNIERASSALEKGMQANMNRNKHILIADQSDAGWATVDEYLLRDVASDSEDDRRIRKAEATAQRKLQQKRRGGRKWNYKPSYNTNNNNQGFVSDPAFQQYGYRPNPKPTQSYTNFNNNRCHICQELGHWKKFCPRRFNMPSTITNSKQA